MSWIDRALPAERSLEDVKYFLQITLLTFFAYLIAAELAFFVGTLSDKIFAPFWPPNIVLLSALLLARRGWRWIAVLAAFPAHVIAETKIGMSLSVLLAAFATNLAVAALSAAVIQSRLVERPWFATFRSTASFVFIVGFVCPAVVAIGGAFVPILSGGGLGSYWNSWMQWFASNALGNLALGPLALVLASEGPRTFWTQNPERRAEALLIGTLLIVVCSIVFDQSTGQLMRSFLPVLFYLPVPLVLWSASRFGAKGASAAILVMAVVLIWRSLGSSLFLSGTPEIECLRATGLFNKPRDTNAVAWIFYRRGTPGEPAIASGRGADGFCRCGGRCWAMAAQSSHGSFLGHRSLPRDARSAKRFTGHA